MCAPHDMFGFKRRTPGGMAEYMVYNKDALVYKISPDLPPAHAAFTEPLSCALHAVERERSSSRTLWSSRGAALSALE